MSTLSPSLSPPLSATSSVSSTDSTCLLHEFNAYITSLCPQSNGVEPSYILQIQFPIQSSYISSNENIKLKYYISRSYMEFYEFYLLSLDISHYQHPFCPYQCTQMLENYEKDVYLPKPHLYEEFMMTQKYKYTKKRMPMVQAYLKEICRRFQDFPTRILHNNKTEEKCRYIKLLRSFFMLPTKNAIRCALLNDFTSNDLFSLPTIEEKKKEQQRNKEEPLSNRLIRLIQQQHELSSILSESLADHQIQGRIKSEEMELCMLRKLSEKQQPPTSVIDLSYLYRLS